MSAKPTFIFTAGPWGYRRFADDAAPCAPRGPKLNYIVFDVAGTSVYHAATFTEADSALIAAAPRLYEALRYASERLNELGEGHAIIADALRAAEGLL